MRIIAFIGTSGTGKSHRSSYIAKNNNIDYIIDDGLLTDGNKIIAGKSAKREPTKIGSVKCALFKDEEHCFSVKRAIQDYKPSSILILGTSVGMVEFIAKRLALPTIERKIFIEDVSTQEEIKLAQKIRQNEGKHVIPVPTFAIKKDFSGFFLDPLQVFRSKGQGHYQLMGEKSVVRPTFSYMGRYTISDYAIFQIVEVTTLQNQNIHKISRFRIDNKPEGISIDMDLVLVYGCILKPTLAKVQKAVSEEVERLTALNILSINVNAKSMIMKTPLSNIDPT